MEQIVIKAKVKGVKTKSTSDNITVKSWTFLLSILPGLIREEDRAKRCNQDSPLRFASREEALAFGKRMFEPPLAVVNWSVVGSMEQLNFPLAAIEKSE
jgi:hypothetical protein